MRKIFSTLAICITLIFVCYMIKLNNEVETDNLVVNNQNKKVINKNIDKEKVRKKEQERNEDELKKKKNDIKKDDKSNTIKQNKSNIKDKDQNSDDKKTQNVEKKYEKTEPVFKVDKNTIVSRVSFKDKAKLLMYSRKLSTSDEAKIKELIKSNDELNSSVKIFKILKLRLEEDDYNSVKKILAPYINVNLIEKNIK